MDFENELRQENVRLRAEIQAFLDAESSDAAALGLESGVSSDDNPFVLCESANWDAIVENRYLREIKEWVTAPVKPIIEWLEPRPVLLDTRVATAAEIKKGLNELIYSLYRANQVIACADHLSDRRLYDLIVKGVLTCKTKYLPDAQNPTHWNFCYYTERGFCDEGYGVWLSYYANTAQRLFAICHFKQIPPKRTLPYHRDYYAEAIPRFY